MIGSLGTILRWWLFPTHLNTPAFGGEKFNKKNWTWKHLLLIEGLNLCCPHFWKYNARIPPPPSKKRSPPSNFRGGCCLPVLAKRGHYITKPNFMHFFSLGNPSRFPYTFASSSFLPKWVILAKPCGKLTNRDGKSPSFLVNIIKMLGFSSQLR